MEELQNIFKKLIELMGFSDFSLTYDSESNRVSIFIGDMGVGEKLLPAFVSNFDRLAKLIAQKYIGTSSIFIDINSYRRERENLIIELARGAARKAISSKEMVALPAMNAYERRLIHAELSPRPDVKTESIGEGRNRYVVVKPISE